MAPIPGYNVAKAAQVVAFFAIKQGGRINVLKLIKLVYLADRSFLAKYDSPILYDRLVSMPHGPVHSLTLNYVNGLMDDLAEWDRFVADRDRHEIGIARQSLRVDDLSELSDAEVAELEETWDTFGKMTQFQLRDYTHEHCPEWQDPKGSSTPIEYRRVLECLQKDPAIAELIDEDRALASLR